MIRTRKHIPYQNPISVPLTTQINISLEYDSAKAFAPNPRNVGACLILSFEILSFGFHNRHTSLNKRCRRRSNVNTALYGHEADQVFWYGHVIWVCGLPHAPLNWFPYWLWANLHSWEGAMISGSLQQIGGHALFGEGYASFYSSFKDLIIGTCTLFIVIGTCTLFIIIWTCS